MALVISSSEWMNDHVLGRGQTMRTSAGGGRGLHGHSGGLGMRVSLGVGLAIVMCLIGSAGHARQQVSTTAVAPPVVETSAKALDQLMGDDTALENIDLGAGDEAQADSAGREACEAAGTGLPTVQGSPLARGGSPEQPESLVAGRPHLVRGVGDRLPVHVCRRAEKAYRGDPCGPFPRGAFRGARTWDQRVQ